MSRCYLRWRHIAPYLGVVLFLVGKLWTNMNIVPNWCSSTNKLQLYLNISRLRGFWLFSNIYISELYFSLRFRESRVPEFHLLVLPTKFIRPRFWSIAIARFLLFCTSFEILWMIQMIFQNRIYIRSWRCLRFFSILV